MIGDFDPTAYARRVRSHTVVNKTQSVVIATRVQNGTKVWLLNTMQALFKNATLMPIPKWEATLAEAVAVAPIKAPSMCRGEEIAA
jgi:hypothetical protein